MYKIDLSFSYKRGGKVDEELLLKFVNYFTGKKINSAEFFFNVGQVNLENGYLMTVSKDDKIGLRLNTDTTKNINDLSGLCSEIYLNSNFTTASFIAYKAKSDLKLDPTFKQLQKDKMLELAVRGVVFSIIDLWPEENFSSRFRKPRIEEGFGDEVLEKIKDHVYFYHKKENGSIIIQLTETYDPINFDENYYNKYKKVYEIIKENMDS